MPWFLWLAVSCGGGDAPECVEVQRWSADQVVTYTYDDHRRRLSEQVTGDGGTLRTSTWAYEDGPQWTTIDADYDGDGVVDERSVESYERGNLVLVASDYDLDGVIDARTSTRWEAGHRVADVRTNAAGVVIVETTWTWDADDLVSQHVVVPCPDGRTFVADDRYVYDEAGREVLHEATSGFPDEPPEPIRRWRSVWSDDGRSVVISYDRDADGVIDHRAHQTRNAQGYVLTSWDEVPGEPAGDEEHHAWWCEGEREPPVPVIVDEPSEPDPPSVEVYWDSYGVHVEVTGPVGDYELGLAETGVGEVGWFSESCIHGEEPWGYDDFGLDLCHRVPLGDTLLASVGSIDQVGTTTTLFHERHALDVTYMLRDLATNACWAWGDDPSYYANEGCALE
jgi:hypothetical protein